MTWEEFSDLFHQQFVGDATRDLCQTEFDTLRQDARSVAEYEQEFDRLIHYAPQYCGLEDQKTRKFIIGLRPEVHKALVHLSITSYHDTTRRLCL